MPLAILSASERIIKHNIVQGASAVQQMRLAFVFGIVLCAYFAASIMSAKRFMRSYKRAIFCS